MDDNKDFSSNLGYEYTQETSLHGIARITNKQKSIVIRILWLLVFLLMVGVFLYFFIHVLIKYYSYPVTSKFTYTTKSQIEFPSVTLCNYNQITATYLAMKNDPLLNATVEYLDRKNALSSVELNEYMKKINVTELYTNGAHKYQDTFMTCEYPGISTNPYGCAFPDGLHVSTITGMGMCFTFHPNSYIETNGTLIATRSGSKGGLLLRVNARQFDYMFGGLSGGLKVLVHDPKVFPLVEELGTSIYVGAASDLVITRIEMESLPYPYSPKNDSCLDTEADNFVNPLRYHEHYSYSACTEEHKVIHVLEKCQCKLFLMHAPNEKNCSIYDSVTCVAPALVKYYRNESKSDCRKPCHNVQYDVSVSQSYFPNDHSVEGLEKALGRDNDFIRKNVASINIYFGELGYTKIEQEAGYSTQSVFAECGGYLGLCLGASMLTLAELLELFYEMFYRWLRKPNKVIDLEAGKISEKY